MIFWRDVFVVIDNGCGQASDYHRLRDLVRQQAARNPGGVGGLAIIPEHARPPGDEARKAINKGLGELGSRIRGYCWLVEGRGFQGSMVRGVLTGLTTFGRFPFPTNVFADMIDALDWLIECLGHSELNSEYVRVATGNIQIARLKKQFVCNL